MAISHEDTLLLFLLLFSIIDRDRVCVFLVLLSSFLLAAVAFSDPLIAANQQGVIASSLGESCGCL
jgi:hypothetical protein